MSVYTGLNRRVQILKEKVCTVWARLTLPLKGDVRISEKLTVRGHIYISNYGIIEIGNNVTINSAGWANPIGCGTKSFFRVFPEAIVKIGNHTGISNCAITAMQSVTIGNYALIGSGVKIFDTDFHPLEAQYRYGELKDNSKARSKPVTIEDGAFIGAGSFILKGSHIGKNSIIGAGSVVSGIIPENEIWAGNPAHFIKRAVVSEEYDE